MVQKYTNREPKTRERTPLYLQLQYFFLALALCFGLRSSPVVDHSARSFYGGAEHALRKGGPIFRGEGLIDREIRHYFKYSLLLPVVINKQTVRYMGQSDQGKADLGVNYFVQLIETQCKTDNKAKQHDKTVEGKY